MEFRSQRLRDGRSTGQKNRDNRDEYSRSKDDRSRSKDEHTRGKDEHTRSKDEHSRGKPRRSDVERSSYRSSGQQKLSEGARDGSEGRRANEGKAFSDDSKLSSIVRRIIREEERERRLSAIGQLRDFLLVSDNNHIVLKSAESLLNAINDVFYERTSKEVKQEMAACLGILGHILSTESDRFFLWLFPKVSTAHTIDEIKLLLLTALAETINQDVTGDNLNQFIPMILAKCQNILENADNPEALIAIVDVIMLIAKAHPLSFNRHFKDTVDILVGWHIDTTQKDSFVEYTSQALISFQQFWTQELSFSYNLLGQFLEDMESYVEELVGIVSDQLDDSDLLPVDECVTKISALLRVFTTVVKSIWNGPVADSQYFLDIFERLVKCVNTVLDNRFNEKMLICANGCLMIILEKLHSCHIQLEMESTFLLSFLISQVLSKAQSSNQYLNSVLVIIAKVIDVLNVHLPTSFLSELMSPDSILPSLCLSLDQKVLDNVLVVYKSVMALKSIPLLEEGYRLVLSQLEIAYNVLLTDVASDQACSLVSSPNAFGQAKYTTTVGETIVLFCVCVLTEIGNAKSNLIGMWVLSPNVFALLSQRLLPLHSGMMETYPSVHFAILQALYSHSARHGHFIMSSHLVSPSTAPEGSHMAAVSPTTGSHLGSVLALLADLHKCLYTPYDSRCLTLKWSLELTEMLNSTKEIYNTKEFLQFTVGVLTAAYNPQREVTKAACHCLCVFLRNSSKCPTSVLNSLKELVCIRLCDMDNEVRQVYFELLRLLPLDVATRATCSLMEHDNSNLGFGLEDGFVDAYRQACGGFASRPASGNFHAHNFTRIMAFILLDTPSQKGSLSTWLERQFHSCQRWEKDSGSKEDGGDPLSPVIDRNERLLWFWATWEAAQFCIQSKLRTPLGKPQETFTAIEGVIKKYTTELRNHEASNGNVKEGSDHRTILHARLLLQFVENLEKHLYNASEGCAVAMATPPKAVRTFFRTNRATCHEWLARIRLCLMQMASHCGEPGMVVRHAFELLHHYKDGHLQSGEFETVLLLAVEALCRLRSPEAIQGLWVWTREVTGRKLNWIRAAADMASGKFESAIASYRFCLRSFMTMDSLFEDIRETPSPSPSPFNSPAHSLTRNGGGTPRVTLLSKNQDASPNSQNEANIVNFMVRHVSEGYMKLESWEEAVKWQSSVRQYATEHTGSPLQKAFSTGLDSNYLQALQSFSDLDFKKVEHELELVPSMSLVDLPAEKTSVKVSWDIKDVIKTAERLFIQSVTLLHVREPKTEVDRASRLLSESQSLCESILRASAQPWPTHLESDAVTQLFRSSLLLDQLDPSKKPERWLWPIREDLRLDALEHDVSDSLKALQQARLQESIQSRLQPDKTIDFTSQLSTLRLSTVSLARRHSNFQLGTRLLLEQMTQMGLCEASESGANNDDSLLNAFAKMHACSSNSSSQDERLSLRIKIEKEGAKLLYSKNLTHDAIETILTSIVNTVGAIRGPSSTGSLSKGTAATAAELNARSLVTLAKWLQADAKYTALVASQLQQVRLSADAEVPMIAKRLKILTDLEATAPVDGRFTDHPDSDSLIEKLLCLSTEQCPQLAKPWFTLAGWCYKWGRKAVDNAARGSIELSTDEKARIVELLPIGTSLEETDNVLSILSQTHTTSASSEEDIGENDQARYDDGAETLKKQLNASCLSIQTAGDVCLDPLVSIWRSIVDRVYRYYKQSAKAYFTFLSLNGQIEIGSEVNMDGNITATLRLLRLLVKHAWELRDTLEDGLAHSPTTPWKGIIPQLFSRLNHPEPYVRQSVSDLLCRVGSDAAHLIVYPAVVGYSSGKDLVKEDSDRDGLLNEYLSQSENESDQLDVDTEEAVTSQDEDALNDDRTVIQNSFANILDSLLCTNPRMVNEVQILVSELRRITLLWDELWLGTLTQIHQDVIRRLKQLENEVRKVQENSTLTPAEAKAIILKKHHTVLRPTLYTLEMLHEATSQSPETPHEKWFQETYGKQIEVALDALRNPTNPRNPSISWQPLKQLHHSLQQRTQKRTGQVLNMTEISPRLTALKHTAIAMPGLSSTGQIVTIDSICNTVQILPTKTKPKKLIFIGSNGLRYTYLFKGLEDLHLDERIMQFVSTVNNMLVRGNSIQGQLYRARHYSVTPLGARSGLIQWVDGATPMFSLYKRWQQREAAIQQIKQQAAPASAGSGAATPVLPAPIPRPSELFYSKLNPLLRDKGVSQENRKEWPLSILRRVLEELIVDTPKDLLSKELWCSSSMSAEWWLVTKTYARSTAVMSMIGYIIGLGDRHLDNVLVDLSTGEVVHIDYNVCFEKGKSLRVPEKVPFRMTQNLQHALGPTGVEGTFRIACEHVLKTMRRGRETLLTLLEAFLYDPLVDWTIGNEWGYTGAFYGGSHSLTKAAPGRLSRRDMEREITINMFSIRVAEIRAVWLNNREEILTSVSKLENDVQSQLETYSEQNSADDVVGKLGRQLDYLEKALTERSDHPIYSIHKRYREYAAAKARKVEVLRLIEEKLNECELHNKAHDSSLEAVRSHRLQKMGLDLSKSSGSDSLASPTSVVDFLQGAGQGNLVSQYDQSYQELQSAMAQHHSHLRNCLDVLHKYRRIVTHYPRSLEKTNRCSRWKQWLQDLVCDFAVERVLATEEEVKRLYSGLPHPRALRITEAEQQLQTIVSAANGRLCRLVELRQNLTTESVEMMESNVQQFTSLVHYFMKERGLLTTMCMSSVLVLDLCNMAKAILEMEKAFSATRGQFTDFYLKSVEGTWRLDHFINLTGNALLLLELLNDPLVAELMKGEDGRRIECAVAATKHLYVSLQEMYLNFHNVIIPEAMAAFEAHEPTVLSMLGDLDNLLTSLGMPVETAIEQLEICLMHAKLQPELTETNHQLLLAVKKMRLKFEKLCHPLETDHGDRGQLLLVVFAGLFSRIESDFKTFVNAVSSLQLPETWKMVDMVLQAQAIQNLVLTDLVIELLAGVFFLKQLKLMSQFFHQCQLASEIMFGTCDEDFCDSEQLSLPFKLFICEFLYHQVVGLSSQVLGCGICIYLNALRLDVTAEIELNGGGSSTATISLEELCTKAVDLNLKNDVFSADDFQQAEQALLCAMEAWKKLDLVKHLDSGIEMEKASYQHAELQWICYQWLHEDVLLNATGHQPIAGPRRGLMSELKKGIQTLVQYGRDNLMAVHNRHQQLEKTVIQRLKWAAGANPTLGQTLQQFEDTVSETGAVLENELGMASELSRISKGILHYEAMLTRTSEALSLDNAFALLLNKCKESCQTTISSQSVVTPVEADLMETKSPTTGPVTLDWIESTLNLLKAKMLELQHRHEDLTKNIETAKEAVKSDAINIRTVLVPHHKMMSDMKIILKSLAKLEDHGNKPNEPSVSGIRNYMLTYRSFSENLSTLLKSVSADDLNETSLQDFASMILTIKDQILSVYNDLVALAPPLIKSGSKSPDKSADSASTSSTDSSAKAVNRPGDAQCPPIPGKTVAPSGSYKFDSSATDLLVLGPTARGPQQLVKGVGSSTSHKEKVTRDPITGKALQERNSYAVGVWRRIKLKLDGREVDANKRLSAAEQVDYIIKDAVNADNLAVLFEGWTPWV